MSYTIKIKSKGVASYQPIAVTKNIIIMLQCNHLSQQHYYYYIEYCITY